MLNSFYPMVSLLFFSGYSFLSTQLSNFKHALKDSQKSVTYLGREKVFASFQKQRNVCTLSLYNSL